MRRTSTRAASSPRTTRPTSSPTTSSSTRRPPIRAAGVSPSADRGRHLGPRRAFVGVSGRYRPRRRWAPGLGLACGRLCADAAAYRPRAAGGHVLLLGVGVCAPMLRRIAHARRASTCSSWVWALCANAAAYRPRTAGVACAVRSVWSFVRRCCGVSLTRGGASACSSWVWAFVRRCCGVSPTQRGSRRAVRSVWAFVRRCCGVSLTRGGRPRAPLGCGRLCADAAAYRSRAAGGHVLLLGVVVCPPMLRLIAHAPRESTCRPFGVVVCPPMLRLIAHARRAATCCSWVWSSVRRCCGLSPTRGGRPRAPLGCGRLCADAAAYRPRPGRRPRMRSFCPSMRSFCPLISRVIAHARPQRYTDPSTSPNVADAADACPGPLCPRPHKSRAEFTPARRSPTAPRHRRPRHRPDAAGGPGGSRARR